MKYSRSIVSLALLAALGTGSAVAQDAPGPQPAPAARVPTSGAAAESSDAPSFAEVSKDGKWIKRSDLKDIEALKELRAHFGEGDQNHDGKLDKSEYDAYVSKGSQQQQSQQR